MKIQFEIPGDVQAQQRPRFARMGKAVRAIDPKESRDYKSFVRLIASQHAPENLITEDIKLTIDVYRKIPKSFSKKKAPNGFKWRNKTNNKARH